MAVNFPVSQNSLLQKLLMVVALGATFFLSAGLVLYLSLKGKEVKVPAVVGKSEGEAERLLGEQGLRFKVRNRTTSEKYAEHLVSDQLPVGGSTAKAGQVVTVIVSTGIEAKKEEVAATPKPVASVTPKPKPSTSPSPKKKDESKTKEPDKNEKNDKEAKETSGDKNKSDKATPTPKASLKPSPKPSAKPSPKKEGAN